MSPTRPAAVLTRLAFGVLLVGVVLAWLALAAERPWEESAFLVPPGLLGAGIFALWAALPYGLLGLVGWLLGRTSHSVAGGIIFLASSVLLATLGPLGYSSSLLRPSPSIVPLHELVAAAAVSPVAACVGTVARRPWASSAGLLATLVCGVAAFVLGVVLPPFLIPDGVERYSGEERAYAQFVLDYGEMLIEYPQDPTVALRVTEVKQATGLRGLAEGEECAPNVMQRLSAEVVSYGPFGVPIGKTVYRCDLAHVVGYPPGTDLDGAFYEAFTLVLLLASLLTLLASPVVLGALIIGGALLRYRSEGRAERAVGMAAFTQGALILAIAAALWVYETARVFGWHGLWPFP